jgi:hypothetical protein
MKKGRTKGEWIEDRGETEKGIEEEEEEETS